jgi:BlaI family transcriptional regulator, penicillinase repressor
VTRRAPISLTKLEGEVMLAVWDLNCPVRVRDVADALNSRRDTPLAYTTVQTMLTILKDKGIVEQAEGPGRAYLYRARVSRNQASRHMVRDLADRLFGGRVEPLLLQLIGQARLKPAELHELRDWVDARLRDAKEKHP